MGSKVIINKRNDRYVDDDLTLKDLFGIDKNNEELLRIVIEGIE